MPEPRAPRTKEKHNAFVQYLFKFGIELLKAIEIEEESQQQATNECAVSVIVAFLRLKKHLSAPGAPSINGQRKKSIRLWEVLARSLHKVEDSRLHLNRS